MSAHRESIALQCSVEDDILTYKGSYADKIAPSFFHHSAALTCQTSRGTEGSITALPPPKGRVVQDSWLQAAFLGQDLKSGGWEYIVFHEDILLISLRTTPRPADPACCDERRMDGLT